MDADFKYPGRDDFGLQGLNIGINMGSRVAIVGPNGAPCSGSSACCSSAGVSVPLCEDREA